MMCLFNYFTWYSISMSGYEAPIKHMNNLGTMIPTYSPSIGKLRQED